MNVYELKELLDEIGSNTEVVIVDELGDEWEIEGIRWLYKRDVKLGLKISKY